MRPLSREPYPISHGKILFLVNLILYIAGFGKFSLNLIGLGTKPYLSLYRAMRIYAIFLQSIGLHMANSGEFMRNIISLI